MQIKSVFHGILALSVLFTSPLLHAERIGRSIATVNGEAIYLSEFENNWEEMLDQQKKSSGDVSDQWKAASKKMLLDQMIEERLLLQEAKKRKVVVPKRQLEEGVLQVKNRFKVIAPGAKPTKEDYERPLKPAEQKEFLEELKSQDLTEKEFEAKIEDQLRVLRLSETEIRADVPLPFKDSGDENAESRELAPGYEKKAKDLFAQIEKRFNDKTFKPEAENEVDRMTELLKSKLGESVHARHILIKSPRSDDFKKRQAAMARIQAIKKELENGADFLELANQKSEGSTAKNGGDLGFFTRGQMVPEFEKAAFSLQVGGLSDIIETEFGYHILMVEERKAAKRLRFDDIKLDLANYLYQKEMSERYDAFVLDLRKKADVKVLIDLDKEIKG